jgi:CRP/FNR family transcriptional regulator, anaerobic regulatory protein
MGALAKTKPTDEFDTSRAIDLDQEESPRSTKMQWICRPSAKWRRATVECRMRTAWTANEPNQLLCSDCAVRPFSFCAAFDQAELRELDHLGRHVHFLPRETAFAQEELTTSFFNLLEGVMRLYKLLPDGRRQIVGFALPGDFLGLATSAHHNFSADAIGPVTVCRFPRASFAPFIEDKPHLLRRMNELMIRELSQAQDHIVLLGRRSAEEKVASFVLAWRDRLARLGAATKMVPLPMGRQDIADFLGLTIETVSRTFTKLERDGLIEIVSGGVRLAALERVKALVAA